MQRETVCRGEVTAYLSLIFILLITFIGGIMESASIQLAKNYRRADTNRAMESVFAEYQKELLDEYDLFALDGSYETGSYGEQNIQEIPVVMTNRRLSMNQARISNGTFKRIVRIPTGRWLR